MNDRLLEVFEEATNDGYALKMDGHGYQSRMVYGVKIIKDNETNRVDFLNTMLGGDHYKKLTSEQLQNFIDYGWRYGVYVLSLSNYRLKLDKIELSIKKEMNGKRNPKQIQSLKQARENVLNIIKSRDGVRASLKRQEYAYFRDALRRKAQELFSQYPDFYYVYDDILRFEIEEEFTDVFTPMEY